MRVDKFLKVSRLIKRRTVAKSFCEQGRILVNGQVAGAGKQLAVGDQLTILYAERQVSVRVRQLSENVRKEEADSLYELETKV